MLLPCIAGAATIKPMGWPEILRTSLRWFRWHKLLPTTRWGDRQYARLLCLLYLGYLPRKERGGYNDFHAFFKGSHEIETPLRKLLSDKETLRQVVAERLGPGWTLPILAVLHNDREIDAYDFPQQCAIKPTHSSGQVLFRTQGEPVDRRRLKTWLRHNHYLRGRERNYRGLKPKILVEPLLNRQELREYWVFCLRGQPVEVHYFRRYHATSDRGNYQLLGRYDGQQNILGPIFPDPAAPQSGQRESLPPPAQLPQLTEMARKMAQGMVFARIDLLEVGDAVYVGEVTHASLNGLYTAQDIGPESWNRSFFGERGFFLEDFPELEDLIGN